MFIPPAWFARRSRNQSSPPKQREFAYAAFAFSACSRGITSLPNSRTLFNTNSWGIAPIRTIAMKDGIKAVHVPYKAGSGAVIDLLAGRVKLGSLNWTTAREHVAAKSLIPLAVSSAKRLPTAPDLPTLVELGYPDIISTTWHALASGSTHSTRTGSRLPPVPCTNGSG